MSKEKKNAYLTTYDPMLIYLYDAKEVVEMFGEDSLEDYGVYVPEELIARYKKAWKEMKEINKELDIILKESERSTYGL